MSTPVRLEDFGDVLTLKDICRLLQKGPTYLNRLVTLQNQTGIQCLPQEIPGMKHRYTKESVQKWLKSGVPQIARRKAA